MNRKLKNAKVPGKFRQTSGDLRNHVITVSSVIILGSLTGFIKQLCDQLDAKLRETWSKHGRKQAENMAKKLPKMGGFRCGRAVRRVFAGS
jgi:hypothetical protein